jgi:hypothetical protein
VIVLVAIVSLALGVVGGWWISSDRDELPDAVRVDGGGLTARQSQMVDAVRDFGAAFQAGDVVAVEQAFAPDGVFVFMGQEYRVADGGVAAFVQVTDWSTIMTQYEPWLVGSKTVLGLHDTMGYEISDTYEFTTSGEVLIRRLVSVPDLSHPPLVVFNPTASTGG